MYPIAVVQTTGRYTVLDRLVPTPAPRKRRTSAIEMKSRVRVVRRNYFDIQPEWDGSRHCRGDVDPETFADDMPMDPGRISM